MSLAALLLAALGLGGLRAAAGGQGPPRFPALRVSSALAGLPPLPRLLGAAPGPGPARPIVTSGVKGLGQGLWAWLERRLSTSRGPLEQRYRQR